MVDVETTGTNFDRNSIIQISAVKFDFDTMEVSDDFFDRCLHQHPGRVMDPDCWTGFWAKNMPVYQSIVARAEDPHTVVKAFYDWLSGEE